MIRSLIRLLRRLLRHLLRRFLFFTVLLAASAGLIWFGSDDPARASEFIPAKEIYVIDGDTIAHGDARYRLMGFDTPETRRARCEAERALGYEAKARLLSLVKTHGGLELIVAPRRDKYGRFLAQAFAGGISVADILISEGLARPYAGGKRGPWCKAGEPL